MNTAQHVIDILVAQSPMTTAEVVAATGRHSTSVAQILRDHERQGRVEGLTTNGRRKSWRVTAHGRKYLLNEPVENHRRMKREKLVPVEVAMLGVWYGGLTADDMKRWTRSSLAAVV